MTTLLSFPCSIESHVIPLTSPHTHKNKGKKCATQPSLALLDTRKRHSRGLTIRDTYVIYTKVVTLPH